jgi:hypothetical protein
MPLHTIVLDIDQDRTQVLIGIDNALSDVNHSSSVAFASAGVKKTENAQYTMWADYSGTKDTWLRLADDAKVPALYVDISVADAAVRDKIIAALSKHVRVLTCGQLKAMAVATPVFRPGLVAWLGLACRGPHDSEIAASIKKGFASRDPLVRSNAQLATLLLKWRQLLPVIEAAAASEKDEDLKERGEYIVETLRAE